MIKIKELRKTAGLTQENAAKKLNISRQVFANYENEINQPSPEMLCEIADLFNCSIDYLVGREDEDGAIVISGNHLSDDETALLDKLRQLQPIKKEIVYRYIDFLLDEQKNGK